MKIGYVLGIGAGVAIGFAIYNHIQRNRGTVPVYYRRSLSGNYNARTIPPFGVYIKESQRNNKELLEHEIVHWNQYRTMGLIKFYSTYYKQLKEHGYDQMPMEKEARGNESEYCHNNYTECVRSGLANTISNPLFRY